MAPRKATTDNVETARLALTVDRDQKGDIIPIDGEREVHERSSTTP